MFNNCKCEKEVKTLFRKLAMRLHPDYGGCNELMSLLKDSYDDSLARVNSAPKKKERKAPEPEPEPEPEPKKFYEKVFDDVHDGDPRLQIIVEIYAYAKEHESFKITTTEEINEYLEENGHITSQQYNRLAYIYYAFAMDKKKTKPKKDTK